MLHIEIPPKKLYEGCLLAALAHAVTVGECPELNYEHAFDGCLRGIRISFYRKEHK